MVKQVHVHDTCHSVNLFFCYNNCSISLISRTVPQQIYTILLKVAIYVCA